MQDFERDVSYRSDETATTIEVSRSSATTDGSTESRPAEAAAEHHRCIKSSLFYMSSSCRSVCIYIVSRYCEINAEQRK
jgi:hypothetical protein